MYRKYFVFIEIWRKCRNYSVLKDFDLIYIKILQILNNPFRTKQDFLFNLQIVCKKK